MAKTPAKPVDPPLTEAQKKQAAQNALARGPAPKPKPKPKPPPPPAKGTLATLYDMLPWRTLEKAGTTLSDVGKK